MDWKVKAVPSFTCHEVWKLNTGGPFTRVCARAVLFPVFGSPVVALTEAWLEIDPPTEGAVTVTTMFTAAPTARLARVQVTVAVPLQLQPVPLALTSVTPAGSVSVTLTVAAVLGPALLTPSV